MSKIGIMGGTFDPIHNGHLLLGRQAYTEYYLDEVWYMPSGIPPHKKDRAVTDAAMRVEMTRLAVKGRTGFYCSDFEIQREGNTYTARTLKLLHENYPEHTFFFIVGADSLYEIENWYEPALVMSQAVILAADREYEEARTPIRQQMEYLAQKYGADIRLLHCEEIDISSARLRQMVSLGKSLVKYVPPEVEEYIRFHHLYR